MSYMLHIVLFPIIFISMFPVNGYSHENALHDTQRHVCISSGGATASGSSFGGTSVSKVSIGLCSLIFKASCTHQKYNVVKLSFSPYYVYPFSWCRKGGPNPGDVARCNKITLKCRCSSSAFNPYFGFSYFKPCS
jgi:hypothetical protein